MTKSVSGEDRKNDDGELDRRFQQGGWTPHTHTFYTKEVPRDLNKQMPHAKKGGGAMASVRSAIAMIQSTITRILSGELGIVPATILFLLVFFGLLIFALLHLKWFIPCVLLAAADIYWFATRYTF